MYGWAHNCLKGMIINEYGIAVWDDVVANAGLESYDWDDSEYYPDETFYDMVEVVAAIPELNKEQVLHLYATHVLQYLRNKSLDTTLKIPLARSLYDHMVSLAGLFVSLGIVSFTFPVKVWCSKGNGNGSPSSDGFYIYSRVEGDNDPGFSQLLEATVRAVASEYFGTSVSFEHCATQGLEGNSFHKWKIVERPMVHDALSEDEEIRLHQRHLFLKQGLSPQQLDDLFPFHIVFDADLKIMQCGEQCLKLISYDMIGADITKLFNIQVGEGYVRVTWEDIQSKMRGEKDCSVPEVIKDFCLETTVQRTPLGHALGLLGQLSFSFADDLAVFLCYPDASSLLRMKDLGVVIQDLAKSSKIQLQKDALSKTMGGIDIVNADREMHDINKLKRALSTVQDKLVTKQSFVRYVSHEIRTPLMVVDIGLVLLEKDLNNMLKNRIGDKDANGGEATNSNNPEFDNLGKDRMEDDWELCTLRNALNSVKECKSSMEAAIGILNDLLAYEKIESGAFQLHETIMLASVLFKDCLAEFKLQADEKSIRLNFVNLLPPHLCEMLYVYVDKKKIKQVVRNFMSNAIKFTPPRGTVTISVKSSRVGYERQEDSDLKNLSEEELILVTNSHDKSYADAKFGHCGESNSESVDDIVGDSKKVAGPEHDKSVLYVDGKRYKKYSSIIVSFLDTGVGICKADQHRIFRSIVQFKPDELQEGGGSGLGLYSTY